jgi:hypothetical protein
MQWNWRGRWTHRRSDNDVAAELESHIAMETERLMRGGMSAGDAAFEARRAFGNPTVLREQLHDAHPAARFEWIAQHPAVMSVCAAVLVAVAIVACLAPARRATRIDPNDILRAE